MGETDYNALLYDKMKAEQDKYRDWLLNQPPEEILNHTYEYTMREDIVMCMEELELSPKQAKALLRSPSNIIEEVVLIDKGKILLQETVEELLEKGYSISGVAQEVDHYCEGKNVIGYDELGGLKIAYVLGEKTALPQGSNLQVTAMNLQKLFVKMTEKGGGENE